MRLGPSDASVASLVDVAVLVEEALLVRERLVVVVVLGEELAIINEVTLVGTTEQIFHVEDENVDNVVQFGLASVGVTLAGDAGADGGVGGSCGTIVTRLKGVTSPEQETLLVIGGIVVDAVHGEEVALGNGVTLHLTTEVVGDVVVVDIHHVVQGHGAGPGAEGAIGVRGVGHGHGEGQGEEGALHSDFLLEVGVDKK